MSSRWRQRGAALLGLLAVLAGCVGEYQEYATVEFHNDTDQVLLVLFVGDFQGLAGTLELAGGAWQAIPAGATSSRQWTNSEQQDLSVRPLCQTSSSWYVLELEPTAESGEPLTADDVIIREIIEHPCWGEQHDRYTID